MMRIALAALILGAASLSVTAVGFFAATVADKDHAAHAMLGGSPVNSPALGAERLAL
jgi:hypothetical protein